ncbi:hypothetical protein L6164_021479 [Bauhinia variegata]|uniref:Uncharacterized protein n=1 Tax=Bauhinia variegata TaxID=167791 RepID=A0ACB9MYC2_BAUVA|nr:hypothetical protein L6164_021479 [Bauhinia variegata]
MTILIDQADHFGVEAEQKTAPVNGKELVLDGGFVGPRPTHSGTVLGTMMLKVRGKKKWITCTEKITFTKPMIL